MNTIAYLHNCNAGDLICALPAIRSAHRKCGKKAVIYQQLNVPGHYYEGAIHSVRDESGVQVTMNLHIYNMLRPLLLAQDYIADFLVFEEGMINKNDIVDLTKIRDKVNVNIPYGSLLSWIPLLAAPLACDISEPWIDFVGLNDIAKNRILINRTQRYTNPAIKYDFLKKFQSELLFVGTELEHALFCKENDLNFPRLEIDNFLDLAEIMKMCRFFIGNQSFPWNLANGLGISRILEQCYYAPNCQAFIGPENYGFLSQPNLEYFFEELYNKKGHLDKVA